VVQAADFGKLHDPPCREDLNRPEIGRVLVEREVCERLMVVGEVAGQDAVEVSLAEGEHVIQALVPDRPDEPLREGILPRAAGSGQDFLDTHALDALPERLPVDTVAIAESDLTLIGHRPTVPPCELGHHPRLSR
jgi:hypothetical protein